MRMKNIDDIANVDEIVKVVKGNSENGFFFVPWIGANYSKGLNKKKVLVVGASHYCNHSSICIHPKSNNGCSNYCDESRCKLGCENFQDCTGGNTKKYNNSCGWMNKDDYCEYYGSLCNLIDEKLNESTKIKGKLNSTTIGEVCNFLNNIDNKSFKKFTDFCCNCKYFECKSSCDFWSRIAFVNYAQNFQPKSTGNRFQENDFESFKQYIELLKPDVVIVWGCALGGELEKKDFKKDSNNYGYNWKVDGRKFVNSYHPSYGRFEDDGRLKKALNNVFYDVSNANS